VGSVLKYAKVILAILVLLLTSYKVSATEQIPDTLFIGNGIDFTLMELPLETHPQYDSLVSEFTDSNYMCSGSYRRYKATWMILESQLYLTRILKDPCGGTNAAEISQIFDTYVSGKVPVDWYTGKLSFRISAIEFKDNIGTYEAVVYSLKKGKVTSRVIEVVAW